MRWFTNLLVAMALLLLCSFVSFASDSDSVDVTVTLPEFMGVDYTGDPNVTFNLTEDDIEHGSKGIVNQGDVDWWSTVAPWEIWVKRTLWTPEDLEDEYGVLLQVKYGPPENDNWHTVLKDPGDVWLTGDSTGSGTYEGIDWKVKCLTWEIPPGTYTCTVTFTIQAA